MYFYTHKNNKNKQAQLLEMCSNAGFRFRNDAGLCTIIIIYDSFKKLRAIVSATFSFKSYICTTFHNL